MKAYLCLADGRIFPGESIGLAGEASGEVVFNTSMIGYQEILTDPTCAGQIIAFTYPLIGNYGVNKEDEVGGKVLARGLIIKESCSEPSNYRSEQNLHSYLVDKGVVGIKDVDTRALTRHLRTTGTMLGLISNGTDLTELKKRAAALEPISGPQLVKSLSTPEITTITDGEYPLVLVDLGAKEKTIPALKNLDCRITVVPADTAAEEILALNPWGVVLSDGPGDPQDVSYAVPVVQDILERDIPLMGIGLGHQILGLALGGKTYKLKAGHRGGNQPVKNLLTGRVHITEQNHGYVLTKDSLERYPEFIQITHLNLNDQTVEGIRHKTKPAISLQYHPENCPKAQDTFSLWQEFGQMVQKFGEKRGEQHA